MFITLYRINAACGRVRPLGFTRRAGDESRGDCEAGGCGGRSDEGSK